MAEAIVPRDRSGLILRLLFLTALLGIGTGVFFKTNQAEAAPTDYSLAITSSQPSPVPAGTTYNHIFTITDGASAANANGFLTVNITFVQTGGNRAQVGADYDLGDATDANWECSLLGGTIVSCQSFAQYAPGDVIPPITVPVIVSPTAVTGRVIRATANVNTTALTGSPDSNDALQDITISSLADLGIEKDDVAGTVLAGANIAFPVTVTNYGPSNATSVTVTDIVPGGLTLNAAPAGFNPGGGFACTANGTAPGSTITCVLPTLGNGQSASMNLPFTVAANQGAGAIVNTANVADTDIVDDDGADSDTGTVTVGASTNYGVTKVASDDNVSAGDSFTYTLGATLSGATLPSAATVSDSLTGVAGLNYTVAADAAWNCLPAAGVTTGNDLITCTTVGTLGQGTHPVAVITIDVPANATGGSISNSASITGPNSDPDNSNNGAGPVVVNITTEVDIEINKCAVGDDDANDDCSAPLAQIEAGQPFVYRILVDNLGPSNAPAGTVSVGDSLPTNVVFTGNPQVNDLTAAAAGWSCTPVVTGVTPASVTCTNTSDVIDALSGVYIDLPVMALPAIAAGTQVCNAASANVSPQLFDVDMSNNTNPAPGACVMVVTISDLGVSKTASTGEIVPGGLITYSIVVTNAGPSAAVSPVLTDDLTGSGTKLVSMVAAGGWTCLKSPANTALTVGYAGPIVCNGPASFPVGGSAVFVMTVQSDILAVGGADTISNTAIVNLPGPANMEFLCPNADPADPEDDPADATCQHLPDSATATVEVLEYDMVVEKTATPTDEPTDFNPNYIPGGVFAGGTIGYTVDVSNLGPDTAPAGAVSLGDGRDNPLKLQGTLDLTGAPQFNPSCVVGPDNPPQFNKSFTCNNQGGEFEPNDVASIAYTAQVETTTPAGTLVCNSATVTVNPFGADTTLANNEYEICNTVVTASDLTVIKSGPPSAQANSTLTYSIVVSNLGPQAALSPSLYETVPVDTTFQSITAPLGWSCRNNATNAPLTTGLPAGTVIRCDGPQTFSFPGTAVFTYVVKVIASPVGVTIENNSPVTIDNVLFGNGACVVPGTENFVDANGNFGEINDDLNLLNNCDQESTPLYTFSELLVLKTSLNPLVAGQGQPTNTPPHNAPAIYRIEVKNTGPNTAVGVVFQDLLPAGITAYDVAPVLEYISGSTSTITNQATLDTACATYDGLAGTDTCDLGNLAVGVTLKFNIRVALAPDLLSFPEEDCNGLTTTEPGVQVCNRATFTSDSYDYSMFTNFGVLVPIEEFDDDKQTVATSSDLVITKTNTAGGATCSGDTCAFTYIVSVDNLGPSDTPAPVQFTDFFPANLTITAVDLTAAPGWFCETLPANPSPNGNNLVDVPLATPATVVCSSNPNSVAVNAATAVIEFDVNVLASALTGSQLSNSVCLWTNGTVPAPIVDPVLANNCVTDVIGVNNGNVITGTKRIDLDGDGNPADVETGVGAGFEIFVDDGRGTGGVANDGIKNGTEVSAITDASGVYTISGLIGGGPWRVCETPKTGYTQTGVDIDTLTWLPTPLPAEIAPGSVTEVDLASGQTCVDVTFQVSPAPTKTVTGVDFLNFQNFSISGFKFEDVNGNGNGVQELNESGVDVPAFTLYVDYNDNGVMDFGEPSSTQIPGFPTGDYKISNVGPCADTGNICQVREVRTAGWIQTYPHSLVANPPFTDANGVPMYPYDPDQSNPLNTANSAAHAVGVPGVAGANVPGNDFSNFKLVAISGIKFNDLDADGLPREAGEPLLGGFKICWDYDILMGCTATDPEVPTTAVDGTYTILVGPGTSFDICENLSTSPSGWTATYPVNDSIVNCHTAIAADSGDVISNINFGNFQNIIRGVKWNDRENPLTDPVTPADGVWDLDGVDDVLGTADDEAGLAGWLICAIPSDAAEETPDCNPDRDYTAVTDVNGHYELRDIPGGTTYRICEGPKTGWVQTYPGNDNCHNISIPSTSGPFIADHIFGTYTVDLTQPFNFGNNSPLPPVDMSVVKTAPSNVVVGANLDFTFVVTNNSAYPAVNASLTDTVNPLLTTTYVGTVSPTPGAWTCSFAAGVLDCARTGDMPANSSETVKVRFTASAVPTAPNAITNEVCVTADNPDPDTADNCSTTNPGTIVSAAPVNPPNTQADLRLDKAASPLTAPQQLGPNVYIDYRIRVRNFGPGVASFVKVTDVLTSGLKFQSMSNQGSYSCTTPAVGSTGTVTCTKATVNLGASNTIVFKVRTPNPVPQDGGGPNQATVQQCTDNTYTTCSTSLNDPNPNNNTGQAQASLP